MVLLLVLVSVGLGVAGQLLLKLGATMPVHGLADLLRDLLTPATLIALTLYVAATVLWVIALSRAKLSYVYPLASLNYVLVVLASAAILHEPVSMHRWIGVLVIAVGFVVVATS